MQTNANNTRSNSNMVLTNEQAIKIFMEKYSGGNYSSQTAKSIALASSFNISSKTVRDIWRGRSWLEATYDLWQQAKF